MGDVTTLLWLDFYKEMDSSIFKYRHFAFVRF